MDSISKPCTFTANPLTDFHTIALQQLEYNQECSTPQDAHIANINDCLGIGATHRNHSISALCTATGHGYSIQVDGAQRSAQ